MSDKMELSEAKRVLLEKYLRGDRSQGKMAASVVRQRAETVAADQRESIVAIQTGGSKLFSFCMEIGLMALTGAFH